MPKISESPEQRRWYERERLQNAIMWAEVYPCLARTATETRISARKFASRSRYWHNTCDIVDPEIWLASCVAPEKSRPSVLVSKSDGAPKLLAGQGPTLVFECETLGDFARYPPQVLTVEMPFSWSYGKSGLSSVRCACDTVTFGQRGEGLSLEISRGNCRSHGNNGAKADYVSVAIKIISSSQSLRFDLGLDMIRYGYRSVL